jgi:type IV secretory pathway VirB10-like protein
MPGRKSKSLAVLLCCLVLLAAGCKKRAVQAAPPAVVLPPIERVSPPPELLPPEPPAATEPEPAKMEPAPARRAPARAPAPPPPAPEPARPPTPQLSPRLTPAQQAEFERNTQAAISTAERNMRAADGKRLNAWQMDLLEKIRGFLAQSREAVRAADWIRALNLADKARTLSVELMNSL